MVRDEREGVNITQGDSAQWVRRPVSDSFGGWSESETRGSEAEREGVREGGNIEHFGAINF